MESISLLLLAVATIALIVYIVNLSDKKKNNRLIVKQSPPSELIAHIENLILLACCDDQSHQLEKECLTAIVKRYNLSQQDYETAFENVSRKGLPETNAEIKKHLNLFKPQDESVRFAYLNDLITMMLIDGDIDKHELDICYLIADSFNVDQLAVDIVVERTKDRLDGNFIFDSNGVKTSYDFSSTTTEFDNSDDLLLWGDHIKTKESEEADQIATKYFNLIKTGVDEMERRYRALSEEGKIEALFFFSAITLSMHSNFTNTINPDAWQDCYFALLWNTCCTQDAVFLNNRIKFYQTENDKLLEESLYVPIFIYNSIYLNPLSQNPKDIQGKDIPSVIELLEFQMIFMEITMRLSDEEMQITHS